jgi:hypothetical protein
MTRSPPYRKVPAAEVARIGENQRGENPKRRESEEERIRRGENPKRRKSEEGKPEHPRESRPRGGPLPTACPVNGEKTITGRTFLSLSGRNSNTSVRGLAAS